jgi:hypothetical protein
MLRRVSASGFLLREKDDVYSKGAFAQGFTKA